MYLLGVVLAVCGECYVGQSSVPIRNHHCASKKERKKRAKQKEIALSKAQDEIAKENGIDKPWKDAIYYINNNGKPLCDFKIGGVHFQLTKERPLGLISAPPGSGKTIAAYILLEQHLRFGGTPAAMAKKAEDMIIKDTSQDQEAINLFEKAISFDDSDALMKYGTWILRGRICEDKIEDAFKMLKEVARRGHPHLIIAAPAYYLKQIVMGIDQKGSNQKLNEWLKIWKPKEFKKYQKGKISQQEFLAPIALEAGVEFKGQNNDLNYALFNKQ